MQPGRMVAIAAQAPQLLACRKSTAKTRNGELEGTPIDMQRKRKLNGDVTGRKLSDDVTGHERHIDAI
jgi:hypothetical protein